MLKPILENKYLIRERVQMAQVLFSSLLDV